MAIVCNISKKDRHIRVVIGVILLVGAFFQWGRNAFLILGMILILEGLVGWCLFAHFYEKVKNWNNKK